MDFKKIVDQYFEEAVDLLKTLVKINSVLDPSTSTIKHPFGNGINECLETFEKVALKDGFSCLNDEGYALKVSVKGTTDENICVIGHLDVVPVDNDWSYPPFGAVIENNKMYGRGTMDDKGPVVASYIALKILKDMGIKFNKGVEFILGTDEETGWRGINHYLQKYKLPAIGFSPDAEFPLINGEKGILRIKLTGPATTDFTLHGGKIYNAVIGDAKGTLKIDVRDDFEAYLEAYHLEGKMEKTKEGYEYQIIGKTAHAMMPEAGINAGTHLANFFNRHIKHPVLSFISQQVHEDYNLSNLGLKFKHPEMGIITNNVGIMNFDSEQSMFTFDIRYPSGFEFKRFEEAFKNILSIYGITYEVVEDKVPHYVPLDDPLVQILYHSYQKHSGDTKNKPRSIGGGTYARVLEHGVAFGMEACDEPSVCHIKDEYINLDRFKEAICIYADAIYELVK